MKIVSARGLENFGGIVDLAMSNYDLNGATIKSYTTNTNNGEDVEVRFVAECKDGKEVIFVLNQANHNR